MAVAWSYWPAREDPKRSALAFVLVCVSVLLTMLVEPWLSVLAGVLLLQAGAEGFFPSKVELGEEGILIRNGPRRLRRSWSQFSSFKRCGAGYILVSRSPILFIRRRRSLFLRCENNREAVEAHLSRFCTGDACEK